jgi:hypothetical protein
VRRLISARARPAVLVGALLAGFVGVMVYINAGQALVSRFAGPPTVRKMPMGRVFLRNFKGIVGPGINYLAIVASWDHRAPAAASAGSPVRGRIEAELARAELDQMRVQLHPQLLEDTLRTTAEFVRSGASTQAVQLLARLSDVLRLTLATLGQERVTLRQELEFLQAYLSLQQVRAPGRLRSRVDIPAEALTAEVPSLALFQLAELPASPGKGRWSSRRRWRTDGCASACTSWPPRSRGSRSPRRRIGWFVCASGSNTCTRGTTSSRSGTRMPGSSARWTSRWCTSSRPSCSPAPGSVPPRDSSHGGNRHHTSQRVRRTIGSLALQPNAAWNWGMFESGPLIRKRAGECGSTGDAAPQLLRPDVATPGLTGTEEELLLGGEAGVAHHAVRMLLRPGLHRGEGDLQPSEVRRRSR